MRPKQQQQQRKEEEELLRWIFCKYEDGHGIKCQRSSTVKIK